MNGELSTSNEIKAMIKYFVIIWVIVWAGYFCAIEIKDYYARKNYKIDYSQSKDATLKGE
jgi:hypothetical protein